MVHQQLKIDSQKDLWTVYENAEFAGFTEKLRLIVCNLYNKVITER